MVCEETANVVVGVFVGTESCGQQTMMAIVEKGYLYHDGCVDSDQSGYL